MLGFSARSISRQIFAHREVVQRRVAAGAAGVAVGEVLTRNFSVKRKGPGSDPLHLLQQECIARQLCDTDGNRLPGVDWRIVISVNTELDRPGSAPNLRTVGIERVSQAGIDFVVKRGSVLPNALNKGQELSFLHTQGFFLPGQSAEQWRGEGLCLVLPLGEVISEVPHFIITSLVGSKRLAEERTGGWPGDESKGSLQRDTVESRSHLTEVMQRTRLELENGEVTLEELNECIRAFRLQPDRIECMWASPDSSVIWDRWEWQRDMAPGDCPEGTIAWQQPRNLVPH